MKLRLASLFLALFLVLELADAGMLMGKAGGGRRRQTAGRKPWERSVRYYEYLKNHVEPMEEEMRRRECISGI